MCFSCRNNTYSSKQVIVIKHAFYAINLERSFFFMNIKVLPFMLTRNIYFTFIIRSIEFTEDFMKYCIWTPKVLILLAKDIEEFSKFGGPKTYKLAKHEGVMYYQIMMSRNVIINCFMDFSWYPFDHQVSIFI